MRIVVLSQVSAQALDKLRAKHHILVVSGRDLTSGDALKGCDAIVLRSGVTLSADVLASAPQLKLIIRAGCGLDNIDVPAVHARGIELHTIPEPGAQAVGEMALALMLGLARKIFEADRLWRKGTWAKEAMQGFLLQGKVLGIVGVGNIGSRVAQLGNALGMRVIGCVERATPEIEERLARTGVRLTSLDEVVQKADFLSLHVPLTPATRHLINARALARMKCGSFLVNLARGGVVDEQALYQELVSRERLLGAALDVHEQEGNGNISPLASLENVILTPHIGANTFDTQRQIGDRIVQIVDNFALRQAGLGTVPGSAELALSPEPIGS